MSPDHLTTRAAAAAQAFVVDLARPSLSDEDRRHLLSVRRLRDGEQVVLADGRGSWRMGRIAGDGVEVVGEVVVEEPPSRPVAVAFAPVKGDRSDWAVAKLTELGVDRIIALATERASVRWKPEAAERALERWRRIARESACQSRRVFLPAIEGPVGLSELAVEGPTLAIGVIGGPPPSGVEEVIAIGPEGGWTESELVACDRRIGLASQVLRTETAAVAAGVLLGALRAGTVGPVSDGVEDEERGRG